MTIEFLLDAWKFFRRHFLSLALIILPFSIATELVSAVYYQSVDVGESFLLMAFPVVVQLLIYPVYAVGIVFYMVSTLRGEPLSALQAWSMGLKYWPSYLLLSVILTVAIALGFAALVLPGLYLAAKFAFAEFELLLNRQTVGNSLNHSWQRTTPHFWLLIRGGLLITALVYGPFVLLGLVFGKLGVEVAGLDSLARIVESVLMVMYTVFAFRVYDYARQSGASAEPDESTSL